MVLQSKIFYLWFKIKKQKRYRMVFPKNGDIWKLIKFSIHLSGSVRKSRENYRQIYGKTKASLWRNLSTVTAPKIFKDNLLLCSFSLQLIFFLRTAILRKLFDIRFRVLIQTLQFLTRLPTRQDGVENRDKVYCRWILVSNNSRARIFWKVNSRSRVFGVLSKSVIYHSILLNECWQFEI